MCPLNQGKITIADAGEDNGKIKITTSMKDDETVLISIADTGVGIPEENIDKVFLPFFTTKEVGEGSG